MTTPNTSTGNIVTNKEEFDNHVAGNADRHKADQIDLNPSLDGYATVQQVLANLVTVAYPPNINNATSTQKGVVKLGDGVSALGDIAGSYDNLKVIALQHSKVSPATPTDGQVLTWDNTNHQWSPQDNLNFTPIADPVTPGSVQLGVSASVTDIGGVDGYTVKLIGLQGNTLSAYSPASGEVIKFRGGEWKNSTIENNVASALQYLQYDAFSGWVAADLTPASASVSGVTTLSNDLGGVPAAPTVVSLTGTGASGYIEVKSNDIRFKSTLTAPRLYQESTVGASAYNLIVSAQSTSNASGIGGLLTLSGGNSNNTIGGYLSLYGGNESTLTGGSISLFGGGGSSTSIGGTVTVRGGNVSSTGGGSISLAGGTESSTTGGNVSLAGGGGNTTSQGGNVTINGGKGGTAGGVGGSVSVSGGNSASYDGGKIIFGAANSTTGGSVNILTGYVSGTPSNSGKISLSIGSSPYVEVSTLSPNRQVLSLLNGSSITSTEVPSGDKVVYIGDATTAPTSSPTSGALIYSSGGKIYALNYNGDTGWGSNPSIRTESGSGSNCIKKEYLQTITSTTGARAKALTYLLDSNEIIHLTGSLVGKYITVTGTYTYITTIDCLYKREIIPALLDSVTLLWDNNQNQTILDKQISPTQNFGIVVNNTDHTIEIYTPYSNSKSINWTLKLTIHSNK